jgi:membrane protein implicated in regulation of membrane protease activity
MTTLAAMGHVLQPVAQLLSMYWTVQCTMFSVIRVTAIIPHRKI